MKNIDYVLENHNNKAKWSKEEIVDRMCPTCFDDKLIELPCEDFECEECWDLKVKI